MIAHRPVSAAEPGPLARLRYLCDDPLHRLTVELYRKVREQCAAAWAGMDRATRVQVSDLLGELEEYARDMQWDDV